MSTDAVADLDILYMPEDVKQQFCLDLLESVGAEKISVREERGEIVHCCLAPWHNETHPSASLNFVKMTYRCLACPARGGILWLIGMTQGVYGPQAREWLANQTGLGGKEFQLAPLLQFLDAIENGTGPKGSTVIPAYSDSVLAPWEGNVYPGLTTGIPEMGIAGRGIPEENLLKARVGWDMESDRIIIPHFWNGDLVGWQSRRILDDGTPKYQSTVDFPRDRTLYRKPENSSRIVVVESPMSVLRHLHHLPIGGTFGAQVTTQQVAVLKWFPEIIWWPDPDQAGWGSVEGYWDDRRVHHPGPAEILAAYSNVKVVDSDWAVDPGDLDDDIASDLVDSAVPLSVWERPKILRCIVCKQPHGGPCA